jgi:hypothetical protein
LVSVGSLKSIPAHKKDKLVNASATMSSSNGPVKQGTVTFALFDSNNVQVGLSVVANVCHGKVSATLVVSGGTPAGDYTVKATYTDNQGVFAGSSASQLLTLMGGRVIGHVSVWPESLILLRYLAWTGGRCHRKPSSREPLLTFAPTLSGCTPPLPTCTRGLPN